MANEHALPDELYSNPAILRESFPDLGDLHILHVGYHGKIQLDIVDN